LRHTVIWLTDHLKANEGGKKVIRIKANLKFMILH
jgi:hypothetical protein